MALVSPYGKKLNQMFGLKNLYEKNHYWFLLTKVFNNSRLYPPDCDANNGSISGPYSYDGYLGGMEGMRQKLWIIITICLIKFSAERNNLSIDIMCQGDNQVVMIRDKSSQIKEKIKIRNCFLSDLNKILNDVNLTLKLEELGFLLNSVNLEKFAIMMVNLLVLV